MVVKECVDGQTRRNDSRASLELTGTGTGISIKKKVENTGCRQDARRVSDAVRSGRRAGRSKKKISVGIRGYSNRIGCWWW